MDVCIIVVLPEQLVVVQLRAQLQVQLSKSTIPSFKQLKEQTDHSTNTKMRQLLVFMAG